MIKGSKYKIDSDVNLGQSNWSKTQFEIDNPKTSQCLRCKIFPLKMCEKRRKTCIIICMIIGIILCSAVLINLLITAIISERLMTLQTETQNNIEVLKGQQYMSNLLNRNITRNQAIPVGFIYTQLPYTQEPSILWNWAVWQQITFKYSGRFFRAEGGNSAPFGKPQSDSMQKHPILALSENYEYIHRYASRAKQWFTNSGLDYLRMSNETRPKNYAVRLWQRIG